MLMSEKNKSLRKKEGLIFLCLFLPTFFVLLDSPQLKLQLFRFNNSSYFSLKKKKKYDDTEERKR